MPPPLAANPDVVKALVDRLVDAFQEFADEQVRDDPSGDGLAYLDAFMAVHNFHRAILLDLERREPSAHGLLRCSAVATLAKSLGVATGRIGMGGKST